MYQLLIVEDEYLVRQGIASLVDFSQFGMTLIGQAENGKEAWDIIQQTAVDILLTDINMPQINGIQLAELVRAKFPQTHIVFLTGYDDFDYALSAVKLGVDDYLLKPFSKKDIETMLAKIEKKLLAEDKHHQLEVLAPDPDKERNSLSRVIGQHLSESDFSLKHLAAELGFSPSHLSVLVKKELGIPFQEYVVQERIRQAKLLLLTTDLKIYEIAERVGFEDMNYFSQRFKQVTGMTPRQYKKGEKR